MSDVQDKEMVKRSIDKELSFLQTDDNLAEKIVTGQIREKKSRKGVLLCAALCAAAILLCVMSFNRLAVEDVVSKNGAGVSSQSSAETVISGAVNPEEYTPREFRVWCPVCDKDTIWIECCLADSYTAETNKQTEIKYHEANGVICGYYEIFGNHCRFCNNCGNLYIMDTWHVHAVVHESCGAGTDCPIVEYWEAHQGDNEAYQKALKMYSGINVGDGLWNDPIDPFVH